MEEIRGLTLESAEESSAAVSSSRCMWLRVPVVQNLKEACRLPARVQKQQAQQLEMDAFRREQLFVLEYRDATQTKGGNRSDRNFRATRTGIGLRATRTGI